jgi:hypothetical protein
VSPHSRVRNGLILTVVGLAMLIVCVCVATPLLPAGLGGPPGAVPDDLCRLVPSDQLDRIVPAADELFVQRDDGRASTRWSECVMQTDSNRADTTATGTLHLRVDRFSGSIIDPPAAQARADFASVKQDQLSPGVIEYQVHDLAGLGDAAYIAVQVTDPSRTGGLAISPRVDLRVLKADLRLDVEYTANPSTNDRVAAVAYAVAQSLMERL